MSAHSHWRGFAVYFDTKIGEWRYIDNNTTVKDHRRPCGHCKKPETPEGHDACLGTLKGVMNACCGHGIPKDAYVQFLTGKTFRGESAIRIFKSMAIPYNPTK